MFGLDRCTWKPISHKCRDTAPDARLITNSFDFVQYTEREKTRYKTQDKKRREEKRDETGKRKKEKKRLDKNKIKQEGTKKKIRRREETRG